MCKTVNCDQYQTVRDFIKENPGVTAPQVHEATGIPLSAILKYIDEGLITLREQRGE